MTDIVERTWEWRLRMSALAALLAVIVSIVAGFSVGDASVNQPPGSARAFLDVAMAVVDVPLAPGWLAVTATMGAWSAIHSGGGIGSVLIVSLIADSTFIFGVWQLIALWRSKKTLSSTKTN